MIRSSRSSIPELLEGVLLDLRRWVIQPLAMAEESLSSIFECLCGLRPERYWLEKYVALNHLYGYLLWADPPARQLLRAVAASRVIVTIANEREWVTKNRGPMDAAEILATEFAALDPYQHMLDLAGSNWFENQTMASYNDAYRATYILQFFFSYSAHKSTRRQDRPSLNKAYAFVAGGHFPEKIKTTRMKKLWSQMATSSPLVYAMQYTGLSPFHVGPFGEDGILNFLEEQAEEPETTKHLVEMAATVQAKFISLLDKETKRKKKRWLKYPENLAPREFESLRITQKKAEKVRGLWTKRVGVGQS